VSIRKCPAYEDPCGKSVPFDGSQDDPWWSTTDPRSQVRIQVPLTYICRSKLGAASPKGWAQRDLYRRGFPELNHHAVPRAIKVSITVCSRYFHAVAGWITWFPAIVPARCVHASIVMPPDHFKPLRSG
jgi:hypothetical protein